MISQSGNVRVKVGSVKDLGKERVYLDLEIYTRNPFRSVCKGLTKRLFKVVEDKGDLFTVTKITRW